MMMALQTMQPLKIMVFYEGDKKQTVYMRKVDGREVESDQ